MPGTGALIPSARVTVGQELEKERKLRRPLLLQKCSETPNSIAQGPADD